MVTLDWSLDRADGVTLVRLFVTAPGARRVRVENRLDGPVWPPRSQGRPAAGWDEDRFEGVVAAGERLVVGYATPARPEEPPAEVVADRPAGPDAATGPVTPPDGDRPRPDDPTDPSPAVEATPDGVVRSLGDPTVPRDAVPVPDVGGRSVDEGRSGAATQSGADRSTDREAGRSTDPDAARDLARPATAHREVDGQTLVVPGAVREWLADVESRLAAVEEGAGGGVGGDAGDPLADAVASDRRALARVARQVTALADRAARADDRADCPSHGPRDGVVRSVRPGPAENRQVAPGMTDGGESSRAGRSPAVDR